MADLLEKQAFFSRTILRALENFKKIGHVALLSAVSATDQAKLPYFMEAHCDITEEAYTTTKDAFLDALDELETSVSQQKDFASPSAKSSAIRLAHLPPVQLPPFHGDCNDWETFRDRFTSLIISNSELDNFSKMHFLVSSLRGPALAEISKIDITAENFSVAWSTLTTRYENKRRLLRLHLSNLLTLSAVKRESAAELHALINRANVAKNSLFKLDRTPEQLWEDMLVHLVSQKLDPATLEAWTVSHSKPDTIPTYEELEKFVVARAQALDEISGHDIDTSPKQSAASHRVHSITSTLSLSKHHDTVNPLRKRLVPTVTSSTDSNPACPLCNSRHYLSSCTQYLSKSPLQRREIVSKLNRCFNCMSERHAASSCPSKYTCRTCNKRHHTSLHEDDNVNRRSASPAPLRTPAPEIGPNTIASLSATTTHDVSTGVLLATAWIKIHVPSGRSVIARALLDQGSEVTLITESLAQTLRAPRIRKNVTISAVGGSTVDSIRSAARIQISPLTSLSPILSTNALVMRSLTNYRSLVQCNLSTMSHLRDLRLADDNPTSASPIHLILGADLYGDVILSGLRKGTHGQSIAQNTIFGWVLSGPLSPSSIVPRSDSDPLDISRSVSRVCLHHYAQTDTLSNDLRRFWEIEEVPSISPLTEDEEQCELHFQSTQSRTVDGRYIVRLPFRTGPPIAIGHSRSVADKVLHSMHRKLCLQPAIAAEYHAFLREYEALGHMRRAPVSPAASQKVYIPHHPVLRAESLTTHLRVVFNASSVTSNGSSLNDHLLPGPKLQTDLSAVILRWRLFRFVYTADITKMYRQILVDERDVDYQRILWKNSPSDETREFQLLTVTYGMTCAPFLALRVLKQLVEDEGARFPLAVPVLRSHIYVDDILFGGNTYSDIRQSREQLIALLQSGKMQLRKWASNSPQLLSDIDPEDHGLACSKSLSPDDHVKILGISWNPARDEFQFKVHLSETLPSTKRAILSTIAKLYDPLGWVTPALIRAKIFIQTLWRLRVGWDDPIPIQILEPWKTIYSRFSHLNGLQIPRWIGSISTDTLLEFHGFADASTVAYAAVVYCRCISSDGDITISLLAGKSKVAPLTPLTIPRLELQAAVLLARLMKFVLSSLNMHDAPCHCWTDSTVALAWLSSHPSKWKTFVAHRVAEVQRHLPRASWRYVPTSDNPADCASRGLLSDDLRQSPLWWEGPSWLPRDPSAWPSQPVSLAQEHCSDEQVVLHTSIVAPEWELVSRFSSWSKLIRVTAYIQRFVRKCRRDRSIPSSDHVQGRSLSAVECTAAKFFWLRRLQRLMFPDEIRLLENGQSLSPKSNIDALNSFLDRDGLLRAGGRLSNAPLPFRSKHPVVLAFHPLVRLLVEETHVRALHSGVQLTLNLLRQEYWLLRARNLVKTVIHQCVKCVRERAAVPVQLMGNLPAARVTPMTKPFSHCGLDYAGPIQTRASAGRGITSRKAYIALFVCLATKAVHLELVVDYSTSAFLNAYVRFCSRRGLPEHMYSDNGTTFVGACRELVASYRAAIRDPDFQNRTAGDGVVWHFIPPSAPHFGGLWEAGVKSVKYHLRRVLGDQTLTFEELTTLLCAIEACLNSRPITPLSDEFDDYEPLTPGHFLIGAPLKVPPQPSLLDLGENRLSRWQLLRQNVERFWKLWQHDYLNTLQQRGKWRQPKPSLAIGQLVLIRNSTLPPCKWELGRVVQLHPGDDGHTRVVTVKTATSCFKRPIVKLCPLPVGCDSPQQ